MGNNQLIAIRKKIDDSNITSDVGSNVGSLSLVQLTERQKEFANIIKENPFVSAQEMSVVLSLVERTII